MKPSRMSRNSLAAMLLAGIAIPAQAQSFPSAHWKASTVIEGGGRGDVTAESEMWTKDEKTRIQSQVRGMTSHMIVVGDTIYQWIEGQPSGMKMPKGATPSSSSPDYMKMDIRTRGKKIGTETIDGHVCDIYQMETNDQGRKAKYTGWLMRDKSWFPAKWVIESGKTKTTSLMRDVEIPANVPESMMTPPANVRFQDMAQMMKDMPRQ
jgi:hypothetical protein